MHVKVYFTASVDVAGDSGKLYGSGTQLQHSSRRQILPPPTSMKKVNAGAMCKMLPNTEYVSSALYVPTCFMDTFLHASCWLFMSCPAEHMTNYSDLQLLGRGDSVGNSKQGKQCRRVLPAMRQLQAPLR